MTSLCGTKTGKKKPKQPSSKCQEAELRPLSGFHLKIQQYVLGSTQLNKRLEVPV